MRAALSPLLVCLSLAQAGVRTLSADFTKVSTDSHGRDSCSGRIFYRAPQDIYLNIAAPVDQLIYVGGKSMVIQYPQRKLAMKYSSKSPFSLPFFQALMGAMEGDGSFARNGFAMAGEKSSGDTSETEWIPRKGGHQKVSIASVKVKRTKGRVAEISAFDTKGVLKKRILYGDYLVADLGTFPRLIRSEEWDGKTSFLEEFRMVNLVLNPAVPAEVESWRIPPDFTLKEYNW